jgi:hypothetical protein
MLVFWVKKNCDFIIIFYLRNDVNGPSKSNTQKNKT